MEGTRYNFSAVIAQAENIRTRILRILIADDWEGLRALLTVSKENWNGPYADEYQSLVDSICNDKDDDAKRIAMRMPDVLTGFMMGLKKRDENTKPQC